MAGAIVKADITEGAMAFLPPFDFLEAIIFHLLVTPFSNIQRHLGSNNTAFLCLFHPARSEV